MADKILGAIDVGTNSFHLVVARVDEKGLFKVLTREKEVVRLGKSSRDMKYISKDAISRALSTLNRFKLICDSYKSQKIRAVATSAVREALNRDDFINKVYEETGIEIEVISGYEEARLIYLGVLQALSVLDKRILLIDIGGGSTEFLIGEKGNIEYGNSIKIGAVRMTHRFFKNKRIKKTEINDARLYIRSAINPITRRIKDKEFDIVVGTSGTITNIGSIIHADESEDNNELLNINNFSYKKESLLNAVKKILKAETNSVRNKIQGLDSARADIITAGAIILEQVFLELNLKKITLSNYALREEIILDTINKESGSEQLDFLSDVRYKSVINLAENSGYDRNHCEQVLRLGCKIFDFLKNKFDLNEKDKEYLEAASILHDIGHCISHSQHHKHSYYLIRNSELLGFNDNEIEIIANIARYHRKSSPKQKHEGFERLSSKNRDKVGKLAGILRIADGFDRGHNSVVKNIELEFSGKTLSIYLSTFDDKDSTLEVWGANMRRELFEESFGIELKIIHVHAKSN